jgi:hypothetical protein
VTVEEEKKEIYFENIKKSASMFVRRKIYSGDDRQGEREKKRKEKVEV